MMENASKIAPAMNDADDLDQARPRTIQDEVIPERSTAESGPKLFTGAAGKRCDREGVGDGAPASCRTGSTDPLSAAALHVLDQFVSEFSPPIAIEGGEPFVDLALKLDPSRPIFGSQPLELLGTDERFGVCQATPHFG